MTPVDTKDVKGKKVGTSELDEAIFGVQPNIAVMEQVVVAQLAARRSGSQSTKTRAEVAGGGAKPWRQKGTGRSRQGSTRSPQWRGGGVALGPKPRSYAQRTPKKMVRLALRSALSDRAADDRVVVLDSWDIDAPSTKRAIEALEALELEGRILVVLDVGDAAAWKSLRNLPDVHVLTPGELNAYDVLVSDWIVFTQDTLPTSSEHATVTAAEGPVDEPSETSVEVGGADG
jgi:large subunit ribosomal protein L4